MKKQTLRMALMLALFVAGATGIARAQTSRGIVAQIPFDFVVGEKRLPAGEYTVRSATHNAETTLLLRRADGQQAIMVLTDTAADASSRSNAKLEFRRYGDQYFLASVWTGGAAAGRTIPTSRLERRLQRELSKARLQYETAKRAAEAETVTVNAKAK